MVDLLAIIAASTAALSESAIGVVKNVAFVSP
jgi:hypothetical protein